MASSTGLQFTVKVGALPPECFAVADFTLQEQLSQPFILQLALASPRADITTAQVLEQQKAQFTQWSSMAEVMAYYELLKKEFKVQIKVPRP